MEGTWVGRIEPWSMQRSVRPLLAALAAAAVLLGPVPGPADGNRAVASEGGPLRPEGRWLVDREGRRVLVQGVNVVWKQNPYHPPDEPHGFRAVDAEFLADGGFNAVRLGSLFVGVAPDHPGDIDTDYLDEIGRIVDLLWGEGIHTLLDFHQDMYHERFQGEGFPDWAVIDDGLPAQPRTGFPGNYVFMPAMNRAFDHLWTNDEVGSGDDRTGIQDGLAAAWRAVAERFVDHPGVMGYNVLNEPWPGSAYPHCLNPAGCPLWDRAFLEPMQERVEAAIRAVDTERAVFFEPLLTFDLGGDTGLWSGGDDTPGRGFSWHVYCGMQMGAQQFGYELNAGCNEADGRVFENAERAAARGGAVNLNTEFGATDDSTALRRIVELAEEHLVGWMYWQYKNFDDPTTGGEGEQGLFRDDGDLGTLKEDKADVLVRPYPRATAGLPLELSFDDRTARFEYVYEPDPSIGAPTEIFVPSRHFGSCRPDTSGSGYSVTSFGEQILRIRADGNADRVEIAIDPADCA